MPRRSSVVRMTKAPTPSPMLRTTLAWRLKSADASVIGIRHQLMSSHCFARCDAGPRNAPGPAPTAWSLRRIVEPVYRVSEVRKRRLVARAADDRRDLRRREVGDERCSAVGRWEVSGVDKWDRQPGDRPDL